MTAGDLARDVIVVPKFGSVVDVTVGMMNEGLDADFERGTFETIGGLVPDRLGRAPAAGDAVEVGGYRLAVASIDGNRFDRIDVEPFEDPSS